MTKESPIAYLPSGIPLETTSYYLEVLTLATRLSIEDPWLSAPDTRVGFVSVY